MLPVIDIVIDVQKQQLCLHGVCLPAEHVKVTESLEWEYCLCEW